MNIAVVDKDNNTRLIDQDNIVCIKPYGLGSLLVLDCLWVVGVKKPYDEIYIFESPRQFYSRLTRKATIVAYGDHKWVNSRYIIRCNRLYIKHKHGTVLVSSSFRPYFDHIKDQKLFDFSIPPKPKHRWNDVLNILE